MKKGLILVLALFMALGLRGQPPSRFINTFGGSGVDIGYSVKETYNRQYVIAGSTTSFGKGSSDVYLILVDSMGGAVWQKTFGGPSAEVGRSLVINPSDSGFVIVGFAYTSGIKGYDVFVLRTNKKGELIWETSFGGDDWDFGSDVAISSDGNIILCGNSYSGDFGKSDGLAAKIDMSNGNVIWRKYFGGAEDDEFRVIKSTSDGYYSLGGNTKSYGDVQNDFWLFKVNSVGDSILSKSIGKANRSEFCYDFMEDKFGNLVFCGSADTSAHNLGKNISYVAKTNINGIFLNDTSYNGGGPADRLLAVTIAKNTNDYFFSRSTIHPPMQIDVQPLLIDYTYIFLNAVTHGGLYDEEAYKVISTSDNGFLMIGYTKSYGSIAEDVYLIKLDYGIELAPNIIGIPVNDNKKEEEGRIYYFEDVVYFENPFKRTFNFEVINSAGAIVQSGVSSTNFAEIEKFLPKDIYFFVLKGNSGLRTKFIKD